jgi:fermentation-respiration switch protein FrsA (DUF1100 family)
MNRGRIKTMIVNRLIVIAAAFIIVGLLARLFENRLIYFPPRYPEGFVPPDVFGLQPEEIWLTTTDGIRLDGYFLPAPGSPKVFLWFHGNAENIGMGLGQMKTFSRLGVNILAVDYRGYGKSEGSPDEAGVYRDAEAAYRYLAESRRFDPKNIYIYGHSLGGAVAVDLASRHECGGLIVESSFTSVRKLARRLYHIPGIEFVPKSRFDSVGKIARVRAPVLIIHGTHDQLIPFDQGRELFEAAAEPKSFMPIEGAGHDDPYAAGGEKYLEGLRTFLGVSKLKAPARPSQG